ncbi:MAG: LytTR family DNA-binding domain-containing protein [Bacteroidota bacterium]
MRKYSCIIIEDEPLPVEVLSDYIHQVPFLELKTVCNDALFAIEFLQNEKVDLIFLDIHLPKLKGLEFLESLKNPPHVIITSAYKDYALQGFELNVIDYLLKPIRFNRFLKAVNKLNQVQAPQLVKEKASTAERLFIFFNVGKKKVKIYLDEILFIESLRDYVKITTNGKSILTKFQLSEIEDKLSKSNFLRVHRSFIVARDKISAFSSNDVEIDNKSIPIGRSYKELVLSVLEKEN